MTLIWRTRSSRSLSTFSTRRFSGSMGELCVIPQVKVFDSPPEKLVVGGEKPVSLQRLEIHRADGSRHARIAAGRRIDADCRRGRITLGKQKTDRNRANNNGDHESEGHESPAGAQELAVFEDVE